MKVEEIALRQEIRQMLNEAGINRTTLHTMAQEVLQEEIEKQVKNTLAQSNINHIIYDKVHSMGLHGMLQEAIRKEVSDSIQLSIQVGATFSEKK